MIKSVDSLVIFIVDTIEDTNANENVVDKN